MKWTAECYRTTIVPKLKEQFGFKNVHQVPRIEKVTVNVGLSKALKDARYMDIIESTLARITGQKPIKTLSRKSIANFKIREDLPVGMKVTLRGKHMWDFLDKLLNVSFARVRDFRGVSESCVDTLGNFSYGFVEQTPFPEITPDEADLLHGLQVNVTTTSMTYQHGLALFKLLGVPFSARGVRPAKSVGRGSAFTVKKHTK
ncbi:MAG: 50S ribosomal protein L5 [Patescibacteria group bacterium]